MWWPRHRPGVLTMGGRGSQQPGMFCSDTEVGERCCVCATLPPLCTKQGVSVLAAFTGGSIPNNPPPALKKSKLTLKRFQTPLAGTARNPQGNALSGARSLNAAKVKEVPTPAGFALPAARLCH